MTRREIDAVVETFFALNGLTDEIEKTVRSEVEKRIRVFKFMANPRWAAEWLTGILPLLCRNIDDEDNDDKDGDEDNDTGVGRGVGLKIGLSYPDVIACPELSEEIGGWWEETQLRLRSIMRRFGIPDGDEDVAESSPKEQPLSKADETILKRLMSGFEAGEGEPDAAD